MATRTLILGGGFGGLATATELRALLPEEHEISVIDRGDSFFMGLRKLWVLVDRATLAEGRRPLRALADRGIRFVQTEVRRIDAAARRVETDEGPMAADFLVIALGAVPRPDLVPGMEQYAYNLYDPTSVEAAAAAVRRLDIGRLVVAIAGLPYKCPPAPYEAVMLLDEQFRRRGVRNQVQLFFTTLQPMLLPNAGPAGARWVGEELTRREIAFEVHRKVERVEEGRLVFDGEDLTFDVAILAPPHRAPAVVRESGLTGGGEWIAVDPGTLATSFPDVYAIGDVTEIPLANRTALPKAGLFAEAEGQRVARAIAARVTGAHEPPTFDGRGACFLEMGHGEATLVEGDFFATPAPYVRIGDPSAEHLEAKHRFEAERLARWFGG